MIRTIAAGIFLVLYLLTAGTAFILHCLLTRSPERLYRIGVAGARAALRIAGVRIAASGQENIPAGVCIFVANHTSNVDPPAVVAAIPRRVALLSKKEVFHIPIFATAMRLASFIAVDRASRESAIASVEEALRSLRAGVSYLVFPEGTRSADGRLRPFKKGSFVMALRAGVPVVPVSVVGAHRVLPKGAFAIRPGTVRAHFHPPVDTAAYSPESRDALMARVQAAVASALPAEQQPEK
jgi:1-acyl-sn-glycerol-3-phosphate acyltransferase